MRIHPLYCLSSCTVLCGKENFEKSFSLRELEGSKFSWCDCPETIWEWPLLERNWIIFVTGILVVYWIGSSLPSATPTLVLKLFSTGSMHFKGFFLTWAEKRKREKWNFWSCSVKENLSFSDPLLPNFYSKFLFCEVGGFFFFFILKKTKYKTYHLSVLRNSYFFTQLPSVSHLYSEPIPLTNSARGTWKEIKVMLLKNGESENRTINLKMQKYICK